MQGKKKILYVIDSLKRGGAETLLVGILKSLKDTRNILVLLTDENEFGELENCEKIISLGYSGNLSIPLCIFKLNKIIKQYKIDVVHSHLFLSTLISRIACPNNVKYIFTIHSILSEDAFIKNRFSRLAESLTYKSNQTVLFVSQAAEEDYKRFIGIKGDSAILYNYVEDEFFHSFKERRGNFDILKLIAVGNLREQKNYYYLLEAIRSLSSNNLELHIFGEGPLKAELIRYIEKHNLQVKLFGRVNNVASLLSEYDLFVMPSLHEGYGIALVEAMANGLPLLISDISVFREITRDNAIFFNPKEVKSLVLKLQDIIHSRINLANYSKNGLHIAKSLADKSNFIEKLTTLYNK